MRLSVGEQVTILPPYTDDPVIIEHQHHGLVAARTDDGYFVEIEGTMPPNQRFGPFPERRLARGWKDGSGRRRP
jgi:hypothetical protein